MDLIHTKIDIRKQDIRKQDIRKQVLALRDTMPLSERDIAGRSICARLCNHPSYILAETICLFVSYGSELPTKYIFEDALDKGKRVYFPKVLSPHTMEFYPVTTPDHLSPGFKGIMEPNLECMKAPGLSTFSDEAFAKTLCIMPGVAFDEEGNRLGYGGGFYDRYLAEHRLLLDNSIAIGYKCQLVKKIPVEDTDLLPGEVILV